VKRSSRDESIKVVIHMYMEAMLGIPLCSYLYLIEAMLGSLCVAIFISSQQKCYVFLISAYVFSSTKLEKKAEQVLPGSEGGVGENGPNNVCTL
jgi:hypothetical protein